MVAFAMHVQHLNLVTYMKTLSVIVDSNICTNEKPGQKEQICIDITIKKLLKYHQLTTVRQNK